MSRNNSPARRKTRREQADNRARRKTRREQADNRARRNEVIDCACGNRHATTWRGCSVLPDDPGVRLLREIFTTEEAPNA